MNNAMARALIEFASHGGSDPTPLIRALSQRQESPKYPRGSKQTRPQPQGDGEGGGSGETSLPVQHVGDMTILPTTWKGTHVTSGLGWNTKTAQDLFPGGPGTPIGAPQPGTVVYWHPTGAQGGGSMLIKTYTGHEYWLGHLASGVPAGTKVKRGSYIAKVAAIPVPHVHEDYR